MQLRFDAELWVTEGEAGWHFITLPVDLAEDVRDHSEGRTAGFGSVPVKVTIGATSWSTSIFPDKRRNSFVLPLKKAVRKAELLEVGDVADVQLFIDLE
jgi:Domain of unknown function (DUF1905)